MHRLVHPQAFDVGPVENRQLLAGELPRIVERRELDELRLRRRLAPLDEIGEREPDPRNHHRPRFDAAVAVDAILERLALEDVFEVHLAGLRALPFHGDRPRLGRLEDLGHPRRSVAGPGLELVEVVVGGDVLPRVRRLGRAERALLGDQLPPVRRGHLGLQQRPGGERAGRGGERRPARSPDELASIQIHLLVGDFGARNIRRRFDQHKKIPEVKRCHLIIGTSWVERANRPPAGHGSHVPSADVVASTSECRTIT